MQPWPFTSTLMLKPESALKMWSISSYSTPNLPAKELLPEGKRDKTWYPDAETMETPRSL